MGARSETNGRDYVEGDEDEETDAHARPISSESSRPSTAAAFAKAAASMSLESAVQAVRGTIDSRDIEGLEALLGVVRIKIHN